MKVLIILFFLLSQTVIAQTYIDSIKYSTEIYDEVKEWTYKNKGNIISPELQIIRYVLFEIDVTVYFIKNFEPLDIKLDTRLREGVQNALVIQFNKGYSFGHADGYNKGWKAAKDDSGSKTFYAIIVAVVVSAGVTYGIMQIK